MNKYIIMHKTTYEYIQKCLYSGERPPIPIQYGGFENISMYGMQIIIQNKLEPTIDEPEWVFPKERFVIYENKDIEWCKFFGIGRPGRPFKLGEIYEVNPDMLTYFSLPFNQNGIRTIFPY